MENTIFMNAKEVAQVLGTSKSYAYKVIKELNEEMSKTGYITIAGKINRHYFNERIYGKENVSGYLQG